MLDNETKRRIDTARDILVGKVPDPKSQVEQITIALIYKFMDDMDAESEELGGKRKFFTSNFARFGWKKLMSPSLGGIEVLNLYAEAIQKMNINPNIPQLFRNIFKNAYLPYRDPETLKSFLKIIDDFEYDHSERLGDAFEYLLSVLGSQGDAGQFRTPRHIIDFMVEIIAPKKNETILDPACGTAGFLISSYKHIIKHNSSNFIPEVEKESFEQVAPSVAELTSSSIAKYKGDKLTPDERKKLAQNITGYDISPDMVRLSLVNLYLHGFIDPKIIEYDTLTSEDNWNEYADVILANPPFMSPKGGIKPHKRFSIQSNRSEVLFVDYMIEHLTPNGRAAIIVPEGIIFQSGTAYKQLRKMLVENYLFAVVSLPAGVFNPYSGVKTSILLIDKALNKKTNNILFAKIENDGFDLGAQRRPNNKSELRYTVKSIKNYVNSVISSSDFNLEGYNNLVIATKEKIAENEDWNLSGERYRQSIQTISNFKFVSLGDICEVYQPQTISQKDMIENGEYLVWGANGIIGKYDKYNHGEGEVLITCRGATCGTINMSSPKSWITGNAMVVKPKSNAITKQFLFYLLRHTDLSSTISGAAQQQITRQSLAPFQIPLPPLDIQKEIIAEVEGYQKIIDGARQVVENYKPQIQIDPSWPMVELSHVIKLSSGRGLTSSNMIAGNYPVYGGNGINGYHIEYFLEQPTIVIGRVGAYCGSVHLTQPKSWVTDNGLYVTDYLLEINIKYLAQLLTQLNLNKYAKVGGQPSISQKTVTELSIPIPDIKVQEQIVLKLVKEESLVVQNKELITIFEQKIKDKIASVWGE